MKKTQNENEKEGKARSKKYTFLKTTDKAKWEE
jgi:hypothetical protein